MGIKDDDTTTLASRSRVPPGQRVRRFRLRIVEGPEAGRELVVDESLPPRVLIGQSQACELRLDDREVSRRHAALSLEGARLRVVDQGSTNGTFVDGVLVRDASLSGGETLTVGSTKLRVDVDGSDAIVSLPPAASFGRLQGSSSAMRRIFSMLERLAQTTVPVVIEGEPGTGKELCAEAIHERGPRAEKPFVVLDCAATAPDKIEAALAAAFAEATGGTLVVSEVADLDRALQAKLLRLIERGDADVRMIVTSRKNLDREVHEGRFREDLFFRIMVARVDLPALRERADDVPVLANHFWQASGQGGDLPRAIIDEWRSRPWPGNVRELENAIARLGALGDVRVGLDPKSVPPASSASSDAIDRVLTMNLGLSSAREIVVREFEKRYVEKVTADHGGNVTHAAKAAGVALRYFQLLRAKRAM